MGNLLNDLDLIDRIFSHIDGKSTDAGGEVWREPVENYTSEERFAAEIRCCAASRYLSAPLPQSRSRRLHRPQCGVDAVAGGAR